MQQGSRLYRERGSRVVRSVVLGTGDEEPEHRPFQAATASTG